jgi:hypothetical protein
VVRSSDFLRASERATALATLIRQRRLTPSCGGHAPTAERTVGPARMIVESLTPRPGIREHNRVRSGHCADTANRSFMTHSVTSPLPIAALRKVYSITSSAVASTGGRTMKSNADHSRCDAMRHSCGPIAYEMWEFSHGLPALWPSRNGWIAKLRRTPTTCARGALTVDRHDDCCANPRHC